MKKYKFLAIFKCLLFGSTALMPIWNIIKMLFYKFDKNLLIQNMILVFFFGFFFLYSYKDYKKKKALYFNLNPELNSEDDYNIDEEE